MGLWGSTQTSDTDGGLRDRNMSDVCIGEPEGSYPQTSLSRRVCSRDRKNSRTRSAASRLGASAVGCALCGGSCRWHEPNPRCSSSRTVPATRRRVVRPGESGDRIRGSFMDEACAGRDQIACVAGSRTEKYRDVLPVIRHPSDISLTACVFRSLSFGECLLTCAF